jgi:hypothetical protein
MPWKLTKRDVAVRGAHCLDHGLKGHARGFDGTVENGATIRGKGLGLATGCQQYRGAKCSVREPAESVHSTRIHRVVAPWHQPEYHFTLNYFGRQ